MSENANTNKGLQKIPLCTYKRILHCDCICQSTLHKWRLLGKREYNITKRTVKQKMLLMMIVYRYSIFTLHLNFFNSSRHTYFLSLRKINLTNHRYIEL